MVISIHDEKEKEKEYRKRDIESLHKITAAFKNKCSEIAKIRDYDKKISEISKILRLLSEASNGLIPYKRGSIKDGYCKTFWKCLDALRMVINYPLYEPVLKHIWFDLLNEMGVEFPKLIEQIDEIITKGKSPPEDLEGYYKNFPILYMLTKHYLEVRNLETIRDTLKKLIGHKFKNQSIERCAVLRALEIWGECLIPFETDAERQKLPADCQALIEARTIVVHILTQGTKQQYDKMNEFLLCSNKDMDVSFNALVDNFELLMVNVNAMHVKYKNFFEQHMCKPIFIETKRSDVAKFMRLTAIMSSWEGWKVSKAIADFSGTLSASPMIAGEKESKDETDKLTNRLTTVETSWHWSTKPKGGSEEFQQSTDKFKDTIISGFDVLPIRFIKVFRSQAFSLYDTCKSVSPTELADKTKIFHLGLEYYIINLGGIIKLLRREKMFKDLVPEFCQTAIEDLDNLRDRLGHEPHLFVLDIGRLGLVPKQIHEEIGSGILLVDVKIRLAVFKAKVKYLTGEMEKVVKLLRDAKDGWEKVIKDTESRAQGTAGADSVGSSWKNNLEPRRKALFENKEGLDSKEDFNKASAKAMEVQKELLNLSLIEILKGIQEILCKMDMKDHCSLCTAMGLEDTKQLRDNIVLLKQDIGKIIPSKLLAPKSEICKEIMNITDEMLKEFDHMSTNVTEVQSRFFGLFREYEISREKHIEILDKIIQTYIPSSTSVPLSAGSASKPG